MLSKASQRPTPKSEETQPKSDRDSETQQARDDAKTKSTSRKSKTEKTAKPHSRKRTQGNDGEAAEAEDAGQSAEKSDPAAADASADQSSDDSESEIDAESAEARPHASDDSDERKPDAEAAALAQQPARQPIDPKTPAETDEADDSETTANVEAVAKATPQQQTQVKTANAKSIKDSGGDGDESADPVDAAHASALTSKSPRAGDRLAIPRKDAESANERRAATGASQKPSDPTDPTGALPQTDAFQQLAGLFDDAESSKPQTKSVDAKETTASPDMTRFVTPTHTGQAHDSNVSAIPDSPQAELTPEARFAEENHEKIVSGVRGELLPNGGTMRLRLDPPELGTLQVSLHMRDGVVSAQFQTANGDAANLLSHTLSDLRSTLEAHGIVVDKLHVQQSPREESDSGTQQHGSQSRDQSYEQQQDARREQQRKDMIQKMWDRLSGLAPIDLVA
jgi:flagellar hook-length control protein FliK